MTVIQRWHSHENECPSISGHGNSCYRYCVAHQPFQIDRVRLVFTSMKMRKLSFVKKMSLKTFIFFLLGLSGEFNVCDSMTTSTMRPVNNVLASEACGDDLLPEPLSCGASVLPPLDGGGDSGIEVELNCSWMHQYPVQNVSFLHGFTPIQPQLELTDDMTALAREKFSVSESDLRVVGFFCYFSYLHPLCGMTNEHVSCPITEAEVRTDPLLQHVSVGEITRVSCQTRSSDIAESVPVTWQKRRASQTEFSSITNSTRYRIASNGDLTMLDVRPRDDFLLVKCDIEGSNSTKNFGISQIRVGEEPSVSPTMRERSSTATRTTGSMRQTTNNDVITKITTLQPSKSSKPTESSLFWENLHIVIPVFIAPFAIVIFMCIIVFIARRRRDRKVIASSEPANIPDARMVNDNTYEYNPTDDTIEHEYFESCKGMQMDSISQQSEYVNNSMIDAKHKGRATRLLRSKSDSRLAHMANDPSLEKLPQSQSFWALPGLSESTMLQKPMPELPGRKRSMTVGAINLKPPVRDAARPLSPEYAMIDETMFTQSIDLSRCSDTQPYACTDLQTRAKTMDAKIFIARRKQQKKGELNR